MPLSKMLETNRINCFNIAANTPFTQKKTNLIEFLSSLIVEVKFVSPMGEFQENRNIGVCYVTLLLCTQLFNPID